MTMHPIGRILCACVCATLFTSQIVAQERINKENAAVTIEGVVREVFRSQRQGQTDVLVQIDVKRSEGNKVIQGPARPNFPAPGDTIYVHVNQLPAATGLDAGGASGRIPTERAQVRAFLSPRSTGGWEGVVGPWFELTSDRPAVSTSADPAPVAVVGTTSEKPAAGPSLGMTFEPMKVQDKLVLRVTSVERGGPAEGAGIEVGDVIIGAKGDVLTGPGQLAELARSAESIPLFVIDVRTGRASQVEMRLGKRTASSDPNATATTEVRKTTSPTPSRTFGVSAETVRLGQRTALKVIRVEPGSPAAKAGVEVGDVLVAADGAPLTGPEQLGIAIRKSGPTMTLTVRDSRTGRDVPVPIAFGGEQPVNPLPDLAPKPAPGRRDLGAVTELAFYDVDSAVKITEVTPGSPAAQAGLEPGILILKVDGKVIIHPNDLTEAVRNSAGKVKLSIVDPRSGKKSDVDVSLGS